MTALDKLPARQREKKMRKMAREWLNTESGKHFMAENRKLKKDANRYKHFFIDVLILLVISVIGNAILLLLKYSGG